jgi:hypothetical protein
MPMATSPKEQQKTAHQHQRTRPASKAGAWLPWATAEAVCRLTLRPASCWRVFLAVLFTCIRYGGGDARLGVAELAEMTGLSLRTVKRALAMLLNMGILVRHGRYGRLHVVLAAAENTGGANNLVPPGAVPPAGRGANKLTPPRCQVADTSPTCIYVCINKNRVGDTPPFTAKQQTVIADVLAEASALLGADAGQLPLSNAHAARLGLPTETTYAQALDLIAGSANSTQARDFTKAVLALRHDPRIQGTELKLTGEQSERS